MGGKRTEDELRQVPEEYTDVVEDADAGDIEAIDELAMMYLNGDGAEADPEKAAYWFRKGAEEGSELHMFNMGLFYAKGFGVPRDFALAAEWMQKAADEGDEDAPAEAERYRAVAELQKKAEAGDAAAQAELAETFMKLGNSLRQAGNEADYRESARWAAAAAEQGNGRGMWLMGLAHEHGRGVPKDGGKAAAWYRKGAEAGDAACQNSLGTALINGVMCPKDSGEGYRWIRKSAEQGYGLGMKNLGQCFQYGEGCGEDMEEAVRWYEKALTVMDDPELARKLPAYRSVLEMTRKKKEEKASEPNTLPPGYMEALKAFGEADDYERELYEAGYLPEAGKPGKMKGPVGKKEYPRLERKAAEGDERAKRIYAALGWKLPADGGADSKKPEKKGDRGMQASTDPRTTIGNFFTLIGTPGLVIANQKQETYKEGDSLATLFDTKGGRQMEMGFFGGIQNGLHLKASKLLTLTEEQVSRLTASLAEQDEEADRKILKNEGGVGVVRLDMKKEVGHGYIIVLPTGLFMGGIDEATTLEMSHYDQVMTSILPCGAAEAPKEAQKPAATKPEAAKPAAAKPAQKTDREICLQKMDSFLQTVNKALKQAEDRIADAEQETRSLERIRKNSGVQKAKELAEQARKELEDLQKKLHEEEGALGSLGLFAFGKKAEVRQRIADMTQKIPGLEGKVKAQEYALRTAQEKLDRDLAMEKARHTESIDVSEWKTHREKLKKMRDQVSREKTALTGNAADAPDAAAWKAPALPGEPAVKKQPLTDEAIRAMLEDTVTVYGPITIQDIMEREPRLKECGNIKLSAVLRSMAMTIGQKREGLKTYYEIRRL